MNKTESRTHCMIEEAYESIYNVHYSTHNPALLGDGACYPKYVVNI